MGLSWLDIAVLLIFITGIIAAKKKQIVIELINLLGVMCATFIALHFYLSLAVFMNEKLFFSAETAEISAFLVLVVAIIVGFSFIQEGWAVIFKAEIDPSLEKKLAMLIASVRIYFICGLIFFACLISGNSYLKKTARKSLSSKILMYTSSSFYETVYKGLVVKFFPDEKLNGNVFTVEQKDIKNKPKE